jgi:hypothetical protein
MVKLTLVKNGFPMKKVLARMKKGWQTLPPSQPHRRGSSPTSLTIPLVTLVLWQKGDKVHLFDSNFVDNDDDDDEYSMKSKMISEFGLNGYNIITKLIEKLEKRKSTLDAQEDLLILEKERSLEL